ncbi:LysR family transcriptional regulator [Martelella sp. AMO21009]
MRWNLRQIEIFVAVAEEAGFTAASERLSMVQPAVSIAVRKLEETVGVKLLDRTGSKVRLTSEGVYFLKQVQRIRSEFGSLEREMRALRTLAGGEITIGAPPIITGFLLPKLIRDFAARYPHVKLSTLTGSSESVLGKLRERKIDVGFVSGDHKLDGMESAIIERHPFVACAAKGTVFAKRREVDWDELLKEPLVLFPKGFYQRSIIENMAMELGREVRIAIESDSAGFVSAMVAAGVGASVALLSMVERETDIATVPIVDRPTLPISICRMQSEAHGIAADALYETIGQAQRAEVRQP